MCKGEKQKCRNRCMAWQEEEEEEEEKEVSEENEKCMAVSSSYSYSKEKDNVENVIMVMNMAYNNVHDDCPVQLQLQLPASSPGLALQHNIWQWCKATGISTSVTIYVQDSSFRLHKYPLISKSGYFKQKLSCASEISLNLDCEIFELVANFCYGSEIQLNSAVIAPLICAAEILEMTEEHCIGNLCEKTDVYLSQMVLKNWQDTISVLVKSQELLPLAEEIQIVNRCIDALAFMACVEAKQFKHNRRQHDNVLRKYHHHHSKNQNRNHECWWMDDIARLPCSNFERIVNYARSKGLEESSIAQLVVLFANAWIFSEEIAPQEERDSRLVQTFECILRLLPAESRHVPVDLWFSLLHVSLKCSSLSDFRTELEKRIAARMDESRVDCFLFSDSWSDAAVFHATLESMKRIVSRFLHRQSVSPADCHKSDEEEEDSDAVSHVPDTNFERIFKVVNLWDEWLFQISRDERLSPSKFAELVGTIPPCLRSSHDLMYKAINTYLLAHGHMPQEKRMEVCKHLNGQKLSGEVWMHAVRNELMPLQHMVRTMFKHQLHHLRMMTQMQRQQTQAAAAAAAEAINSPSPWSMSQQDNGQGLTLGLILKRDAALRQRAILKTQYHATIARLQDLEHDLSTLRQNLHYHRAAAATTRRSSLQPGSQSQSFRMATTSSENISTSCATVDTGCSSRIRNRLGLFQRNSNISCRHGRFVGSFLRRFKTPRTNNTGDNNCVKQDEEGGEDCNNDLPQLQVGNCDLEQRLADCTRRPCGSSVHRRSN